MTDTDPQTEKAFAEVTGSFEGCRDGEFQPTAFAPGDLLEGDIASAALQLGKAKAMSAADYADKASAAATAARQIASGDAPDLGAALATVAELRNKLDLAYEEKAAAEAKATELKSELDAVIRELDQAKAALTENAGAAAAKTAAKA